MPWETFRKLCTTLRDICLQIADTVGFNKKYSQLFPMISLLMRNWFIPYILISSLDRSGQGLYQEYSIKLTRYFEKLLLEILDID